MYESGIIFNALEQDTRSVYDNDEKAFAVR